jgi:thioredoxin-dependent peroxiredoxin
MVEVGAPAPDFEAADQEGAVHRLEAYRGKWVVLYFYPRDDTPGCTTQACGFRDTLASLQALDAVVLGVSADDAAAHRKFVAKHELNFPLLVDPEKALLEAYGVWVEKKMYGKTYMGVNRSTFLIAPDGKVARIWPKVDVKGHADEVRAALLEQKPRQQGAAAL